MLAIKHGQWVIRSSGSARHQGAAHSASCALSPVATSQQGGVALRFAQDNSHRGWRHRTHLRHHHAALGGRRGRAAAGVRVCCVGRGIGCAPSVAPWNARQTNCSISASWVSPTRPTDPSPPCPTRLSRCLWEGGVAPPTPPNFPAQPSPARSCPAAPDDISGHQIVGQVEQVHLAVVPPPLHGLHVRAVLDLPIVGGKAALIGPIHSFIHSIQFIDTRRATSASALQSALPPTTGMLPRRASTHASRQASSHSHTHMSNPPTRASTSAP